MTSLLQAVIHGNLHEINRLLSGEELPAGVFDCHGDQNLFDVAIANQDFPAVSKLMDGLQNKKDQSWHALLLQKKPDLTITSAARLKDSPIFDLLIKQRVGYSSEDLEKIKQERQKVFQSERGLGKIAAILKSVCPSKSLADTLQIPDALAGLGLLTASGLLACITIPAAIVALVGLGLIGFSNYQKLKVEQNINNDLLNKTMLWAQLNNFEQRAAKPNASPNEKQALLDELTQLKPILATINKVNFDGKHNAQDFLSFYDKLFSGITSLGEILCSNSGLAGMAALILTASATAFALPLVLAFASLAILSITAVCYTNTSPKNKKFVALAGLAALALTASVATLGLPLLVLAVSSLAFVATSAFHIRNRSQQHKELAEQGRRQFDMDHKLYKNFKLFKYNITRLFPDELELLGSIFPCATTPAHPSFHGLSPMIPADKSSEEARFEMKAPFILAIRSGNRRWFKTLMSEHKPIPSERDAEGKTLLHHAVETNQLLLVEEMLGVSIAAKARKNKPMGINPYPEATHKEQFDAFKALQVKRKAMINQYQQLHNSAQSMLLSRDKADHIPLHDAAQLKDPSLYNLLLKQPVRYQKADLDKALDERLKQVNRDKWWALGAALIEAICPGNSLSEISSSIAFIGLTASSVFLGPLFVGLSVVIYGFVSWSNYHRGTLERGINTETEQIATDLAYLNSIQLTLEDLKQDPNASNDKQVAMQNAIQDINRMSWVRAPDPNTKTSDFITHGDRLRVLGSSLGSFLCSFAGMLGLLGLLTDMTLLVTSGGTLAVAGPVGWLFLGIGLAIGTGLAAYYYCNRQHELRLIAEDRQSNYFKKEALASLFKQPILQELVNTPAANPLTGLTNHEPHPNCDSQTASTPNPILEFKRMPAAADVDPVSSLVLRPIYKR